MLWRKAAAAVCPADIVQCCDSTGYNAIARLQMVRNCSANGFKAARVESHQPIGPDTLANVGVLACVGRLLVL